MEFLYLLFMVACLIVALFIGFVLIESIFGEGSTYGFAGMASMIYGASLYDQKPGWAIFLMLNGVFLIYFLHKEHEKRERAK